MESEEQYVQAMEKFGDNLVSREDAEVGSAFLRFAVFTRELTALFKNLVRFSGWWAVSRSDQLVLRVHSHCLCLYLM